jgi:hypothetical protein
MMASPTKRVSDWVLERLAAGELPESRAAAVRERLATSGDADRLAALAASNTEILAAYPGDRVAAEVRRRAGRVPRARTAALRPAWALSLAVAGAAATVLLLVRAPAGPGNAQLTTPERQETITVKGLQPSLGLYRKTAAGIERLGPTARLHAGDVLQVRYIAAGKRYGVVASSDARGAVALHLPEAPGPAVALARDGERALAHAYELDDSPGFERFVFVTADVPFDTDLVVRSLKQGAALPQGFAIWSLTLQKETP